MKEKFLSLVKEIVDAHKVSVITKEFGISKPTVFRWLRGVSEPHPAMLPHMILDLERIKKELDASSVT
jgi:hypothetical protein